MKLPQVFENFTMLMAIKNIQPYFSRVDMKGIK